MDDKELASAVSSALAGDCTNAVETPDGRITVTVNGRTVVLRNAMMAAVEAKKKRKNKWKKEGN